MKKLQPLEADHTKLKANFAGCEISLWLRNQPLAAKSAFGCEMVSFMLRNFTAILHAYENLLKLPNICDRYFQIFFALDICCLNPHSLIVIHLQDSLVFKKKQRVNSLLYNVYNFHYRKESGSLFSDTSFVQFLKEVKYRAFALLYLLNLIVLYLFHFYYQPNKL